MPPSYRCPACGYKALRFRQRTDDFVCRHCKEQFPLAKTDEDEVHNPLESRDQSHDFFAAVSELESAASEIARNYGSPIPLILSLSLVTAILVFVVTIQSWPWYGALVSAIAVSFLMLLLLGLRSVVVWRKEHPLLIRLVELKMNYPLPHRFSDEAIQLYIDVVSNYHPDAKLKIKNFLRRVEKVSSTELSMIK